MLFLHSSPLLEKDPCGEEREVPFPTAHTSRMSPHASLRVGGAGLVPPVGYRPALRVGGAGLVPPVGYRPALRECTCWTLKPHVALEIYEFVTGATVCDPTMLLSDNSPRGASLKRPHLCLLCLYVSSSRKPPVACSGRALVGVTSKGVQLYCSYYRGRNPWSPEGSRPR
jgi:hypothetical protein